MKQLIWIPLFISAFSLSACSDQETAGNEQSAALTVNPDPVLGKTLFAARCKNCHGKGAMGTTFGPPLIHKIYKPSHHADASFYRAVSIGVRSHHWSFGDMPKIHGITPREVTHIIAYVRQQQRKAGIQ